MIGTRLTDPRAAWKAAQEKQKELREKGEKNIPELLPMQELCEKIESTMTRMFRQPQNGGNPFLFALTAPKEHELAMELPGCQEFSTAATDGKKFYWNPFFLSKMDRDELPIVMEHEGYHVIFFHPTRMTSADPDVRNWAMDYVVNSFIEKDHKDQGRKNKLWGGNLGQPWSLQMLLDYIDAKTEKPTGDLIFADVSLYGRPPEAIYNEIMEHLEKSPRRCPECGALSINPKTGKPTKGPCANRPDCEHQGQCCPHCGAELNGKGSGVGDGMPSPLDSHIDSKASKQEVQSDVARAAQTAQQMRGTVPSHIEDFLGELMQPSLKFTDLIRSSMMKKIQDAGMINDWKHFRRRYLVGGKGRMRQYLPKRHTHRPRYLAGLDTSGSMSEQDMVFGVSQLQALGNSEGLVVPMDAEPHWDAATPIENAGDLKSVKIKGRGGTVFDDFFRDFAKKVGKEWDCIIILTDGDCGNIPIELKPPIDVVWVLTRNHRDFKPTFGRVAPLRRANNVVGEDD